MVLEVARRYAASPGEEDLKSIKEEMEEGLEQMEKQSSRLLKKKD
jgi:predicted DNA-binding transcriptional regulator